MTPQQVIEYFGGTQMAAARALGIRQSVISDWLRAGRVPYARQKWIEWATSGALVADPEGWRAEVPQAAKA